jgi:hypothetical protein
MMENPDRYADGFGLWQFAQKKPWFFLHFALQSI